MREKILMLLLVGLVTAGVAGAQVPTQSPEAVAASEAAFMLRDGVVVLPGADRIYAMSVDKGVEALTLDGSVVWRSEAAARPLGMYGDLLVAQRATSPAGEMSLALLDVSGTGVGNTALQLGSGATAQVVDGPHGRFHARARLENGIPVVNWQYTPIRTGAKPGPMATAPGAPIETRRAPSPVGGAVSYDPASGTQEVLSSTTSAPPVQSRPVADDFIPGALQASYSADRRHVLVTERVAPGEWLEYRWSIFDAETGNKIGEVPSRLGGARFFVAGGKIIFDSAPYTSSDGSEKHGLELVAMDLQSGTLAWAREIRDTRFYGPFPH